MARLQRLLQTSNTFKKSPNFEGCPIKVSHRTRFLLTRRPLLWSNLCSLAMLAAVWKSSMVVLQCIAPLELLSQHVRCANHLVEVVWFHRIRFFWSVEALTESRKPYELIRDEVNHGVCISSKPLRLQNMERRFRVRVDEMGSKGGLRVLWPRVRWRTNSRSKDSKGETIANSANRREAWMKFALLPALSYGFVWFDCFAPNFYLGFGCWLCCFEQPGCDAKWSSASKGLHCLDQFKAWNCFLWVSASMFRIPLLTCLPTLKKHPFGAVQNK